MLWRLLPSPILSTQSKPTFISVAFFSAVSQRVGFFFSTNTITFYLKVAMDGPAVSLCNYVFNPLVTDSFPLKL